MSQGPGSLDSSLRPLKPTVYTVIIYCDTIFKMCKVKSAIQTETNPQPQNLSVHTKQEKCSCYPSRHISRHPSSSSPSLYMPSYPTFPSHPWGVLCATAETTDGAQHHPGSERVRERIKGGYIHYLHHLVLEY